MAQTLSFVLNMVIGVAGVFGIFLAFSLIIRIMRDSEATMAAFKKRPERSARDFQYLLVWESVMFGGFIVYAIGSAAGNVALINASQFSAILFLIGIAHIFLRWEMRIG